MRWAIALALALAGCAEDAQPAPEGVPQHEARYADAPVEAEGVRLGVPPRAIHRARREAEGLARMPESLRRRALERGRERGSPSYAELRRDPSAYEDARVSYEGDVGLVRPAGERLWILALRTRREGDRWTDPLYVLSVVPPGVPERTRARIDGWVVGERTIGRHTLPLVVAFAIEAL
ncbi:MAG TPA: hypothetical protein VIL20_26180 [Sandaracinaceae bacterium]